MPPKEILDRARERSTIAVGDAPLNQEMLRDRHVMRPLRNMTKRTEAVYSNGVLRPVEDLGLTEGQRVHLILEPVGEPVDRAAAIANLKAGVREMQFRSSGPLPTREELHDRSN